MKPYQSDKPEIKSSLEEQVQEYTKYDELEKTRLRHAMQMSDMEKFRMFCRMMRVGKMLSSAKVTHKHA